MFKQDRQNAIVALLNKSKSGTLSTVDIASKLEVAPMTIRRDLTEMERNKQVTRIYGGASVYIEKSTDEKKILQKEAKSEIGREVAKLVRPQMTVYLGAGTTIFASLDFLPTSSDIQYVTNSDIAFHHLAQKDANVVLTGGTYHRTTNEFVGLIAQQALNNFVFDLAFVSTNGIWKDGATTSNIAEGTVQKVAIDRSTKTYVVADHTKFDQADRFSFLQLDKTNSLITDSGISKRDYQHFKTRTNLIVGKKAEL
ncbi:DeoR/GlpR family DNA-binding transcription regulator [Lacticaseibacillus brantae]|uniref:Lactose phosphotransferase system repressor n=1 Tax=Lacticaseibacillus brantae DSM 23927 TaxID=1423727 RepID=A0A0R2AX62_9LACO|nr:DeoR/GlpR family DNA-binding transcription regulator [Lacticaseibacillus brantae]KRM71439.1 lactose phosphotransferase system repressor [Lacticaseibacillus brantae DSM 23927]